MSETKTYRFKLTTSDGYEFFTEPEELTHAEMSNKLDRLIDDRRSIAVTLNEVQAQVTKWEAV